MIEHFRCTENREWILHEYRALDEFVRVTGIEVEQSLNEVYEGIAF
ncbi:hypothetical protein CCP3SC1_1890001 [Gammaproteobacteria bacterium]